LEAHEKAQEKQVAVLEKEVNSARTILAEVLVRSKAEVEDEEARRDTMKRMSEQIVEGKKRMDHMQEERKYVHCHAD
jgi:hypothetical protein